MPILMGIIASNPNAKLKGVSLVPDCAVVQIAYSVLDNSSTHKPFASSNDFFRDSKMFLLDYSTWLLVCGWHIEKGVMAMCKLEQN